MDKRSVAWKIFYLTQNSFKALVRERGYFATYVIIGFLYGFVYFFRRNGDFFANWSRLETTLKLHSNTGMQGFSPYQLLVDLMNISSKILLVVCGIAVILYARNFFQQQELVEQESIKTEKLLGESSGWIAGSFAVRGFFSLLIIGGVTLVIIQLLTRKVLHDLESFVLMRDAIYSFHLTLYPDILLLMGISLIVGLLNFLLIYRRTELF